MNCIHKFQNNVSIIFISAKLYVIKIGVNKMYNLDKGANGAYSLNYHFIACVKYRRNVFSRNDIFSKITVKR